MPTTTLYITAHQRGPIYRQVVQHLSGIGDVFERYQAGDIPAAERLAEDFADDIRLLGDLGWAPDEPHRTFEVTAATEDLKRVLARLQGEVRNGLSDPDQRRAGHGRHGNAKSLQNPSR